ncbi:MAG: exodeoxyribonuclease VII small subunit [Ruminococcus sp.]|nr:exodeoxyribonuclease VII small subunit [Ruminococcus sp.]
MQENTAAVNEAGNAGFEENLQKLTRIVAELEKGELTLERSVELYGNGLKLAAVCRKQLDEAKLRITGDKPENTEGQS